MANETGATPTANPHTLSVLVVDDDIFNREGVRLYLEHHGFGVIEAGDETAAWQTAVAQRPAAAVIDISIPPDHASRSKPIHSFGIRLAGRLKQAYPAIGIVLFSAYEDRGSEVLEMLQTGVRGLAYKLKGCRPQALLDALHAVLEGRIFIDPEVTSSHRLADELYNRLTPEEHPYVERALANLRTLTARERETAEQLVRSHSIDGVAEELGVTPKAAENYVGRVYDKLGLNDVPGHLRKSSVLAKACMIDELCRQT